jgi:uncharacterized membrane protein HdeD (DUF308 family)
MEEIMEFTNIFDYIILALGVALIIVGLIIWIKRNASLTLDYNWKKVKEEDIKNFTMTYGITYSLMGIFMILVAISRTTFEGRYSGVVFILYFIAYIVFMFIIKRIRNKFTNTKK